MHPKVYDLSLNLVAILENAFAISYEKRLNELWAAHFSLPADDSKNAECKPFYFVEIFDGNERVDLFRIVPVKTVRSGDGKTVTYHLEHVLATLLDDVLFQYHQIGGTGVYTADVLQYILNQQTTVRWQLGTVDFTRQFMYKFENENLLAALFAVPKPFVEEYQWTWDTTTWTLNLVAASNEIGPQIRYRKNLRGVTKEEDPANLCTRLYALGYGEGVNQLTIVEANPTGQPYIDADTQAQYGIIARVWVDRRYEHAETLYETARAMLEKLKIPRITYSVEAADLFRLTKDPIDRFKLGAQVRVIDEELGIDFTSRVVGISKDDVTGAPGDIQIEIANQLEDIASSIAELADRTRINEVYAQGATNLDSHDFADNCDPDNPAVIKFYIPEETVRINKMLLSYEVGQFRAYSKGAASGGGSTSGASSKSTTDSGGQTTSGPSSESTTQTEDENIDITGYKFIEGPIVDNTQSEYADADTHNHGIADGTELALAGGGSVTYCAFSGSAHAHWLYDHGHYFTAYGHAHGMDHTHNIEGHSHGMEHTHTTPDHTHDIDYGIYLGPTPTAVTVKVDGNTILGLGISETDVDIVPYLAKDAEGKITRGTWHEITITPDNLGRIVANVVSQLFVQSRGGGDY